MKALPPREPFAQPNEADSAPAFLSRADARVKFACLAVFVVASLHARTPLALCVCIVSALIAAVLARCSARDVGTVLRPLAPILVITVVMQVLSNQQGTVVIQLGAVPVTAEALYESARMLGSLFGIMVASVAFMRCTTTEELVCMLRWLLEPLRMLGVRVDAFMLALSIAIRFIPVLLSDFDQLKHAQAARGARFEGGVREKLAAYARLFGPLMRSSFMHADTLAEAFLARCFGCCARASSIRETKIGASEAALCVATAAVAVAMLA